MTSYLWQSAGTFRKCTAEKTSFILLCQLDMALTLFALSIGFHELNPLIRDLADAPLQFLLVKSVIPFFIAWLTPGRFLLPSIGLLTLVVGWNIKELLFWLL